MDQPSEVLCTFSFIVEGRAMILFKLKKIAKKLKIRFNGNFFQYFETIQSMGGKVFGQLKLWPWHQT